MLTRPRSLRTRLVALQLILTAIGLCGAGAASVVSLRSYLAAQLDSRLSGFAASAGYRLDQLRALQQDMQETPVPSDFQVILLDGVGRTTATLGRQEGPQLTDRTLAAISTVEPTSVRGEGGGWRALRVDLPGGGAVVTLPLGPVRATIARLLIIELIVGGIVLAALALLGGGLIRVGLHPLTEIERTAEAIARGDLDRRVSDIDPRTETGRLGAALNVMLGRLATALHERAASEATLRQFIADVSHELRTPLTSIRGFAELCQRHGSPSPVQHGLGRIEAEAERMRQLVDDLLLLAALDARRPLERSPVDLLVLAIDAADDARARDPARAITVTGGMTSLIVEGDEGRLRQVLANLLSNALVHTPPDTPVAIVLRPGESDLPLAAQVGTPPPAPRAIAELEVLDRGPGVDTDHEVHVFDRFYRADPGRGRATGGSGLGLSIAAAIVTAHGGSLELRTAPGRGAAFRVVLPVRMKPPPTFFTNSTAAPTTARGCAA